MIAEKSEVQIISRAADCSIARYMACMFDNNLKILLIDGEASEAELNEAWEKINIEYLDVCGTGISHEQRLLVEIEKYEIRITVVNKLLELQRHSIAFFGIPYFKAFDKLSHYGHKLKWDAEKPDKEGFLKQVYSADVRDRTYQIHLAIAESNLQAFREQEKKKKEQEGHISPAKSRETFITTIITLQKNQFVIDRNVTTIEDFGLMIKEHNRQVAEYKSLREQRR